MANAGTDRAVWKGGLVTLDGQASRDPEGDPLGYYPAPTVVRFDGALATPPPRSRRSTR